MEDDFMKNDEHFMQEAVNQARQALAEGEVPIGAVAVRNGRILAYGHNRRIQAIDITRHAEIDCLGDLSGLIGDDFTLDDVVIYSTLEPCAMCAGAIIHYGIKKVVFGEYDVLKGAAGSKYDFLRQAGVETTGGIARGDCRQMLLDFFNMKTGKATVAWKDIELPQD